MDETKKHTLRGMLCTTLGGIFWGFGGTCGQYLFMNYEISSLWLTCVRLLLSGIILTAVALPRHHRAMAEVWHHPKDLGMLVCYGVFGLTMCQYSYMTAISHSNAATTTVLQNISLLCIMLITCLRMRRLPNRREVLSLALALVGIYLIATGGDPRHMVLSGQGLFWGLATAAAVTIYTVLPRGILPRWGSSVVTAYGMIFGGVLLNLCSRSWRFSVQLPWKGWLAVAAVVILGSVVAFSLFMQGVADIGPVKSAMLCATEPVAATVFSALWLHTRFSVTDMVGFVCIIATIFLLAKGEESPESPAESEPTQQTA